MLSAVFRFKLLEISTSPVLKDLLRSFQGEAPSRSVQPPSWDLNKVLEYLHSSTFEPLQSLSLRNLSKKVLPISYFLREVIAESGASKEPGVVPRAHSIRGVLSTIRGWRKC